MKLTSNDFRTLRKASENVTRVTDQMNDLIYNIACEIVDLGKESDSIDVAGETLQIVKVHSDIKDTDYYYLLSESISNYSVLFDTKMDKWGSKYVTEDGYLEDPEVFHPPTRNQKIWFLQHIAEIIKAFTTLWQDQEQETTDILSRVKSVIDKLEEDGKK